MIEAGHFPTCTRSGNENFDLESDGFRLFEPRRTCPYFCGCSLNPLRNAHSESDALLLFRASRKTRSQIHGLTAAKKPKRISEKRPSESTNPSIAGNSKSTSSEIALAAPNAIPRTSAACATPAASISTACAEND